MTQGTKSALVDFIVHRAFYPVLMAKRDGADRARLEHVQKATRAEIERFRGYGSVEEVVINFKRDLNMKPTKQIHSELKALDLPVIDDLREEFEHKVNALGLVLENT